MKSIYLLLFAITITSNSFGQQHSEMVLDSMFYYEWDINANDWKYVGRGYGAHDAEGNLIDTVFFLLDDYMGEWMGRRYVREYDVRGNQTDEIKYDWHSESNSWIENSRRSSLYDDIGNQIERIIYRWHSENQDWIGSSRAVFVFDTYGNQTEMTDYRWDFELSDWIGSFRVKYAFDSHGNKTEVIDYNWNAESNDWVACCSHWIDTYDASGRLVDHSYFSSDSELNWKKRTL